MTGTGASAKMWSPDHVLREVPYTRKEEFGYNRVSASVKLMCDWDDRYNAAADLIQNFRPYPFNPEIGLNLYCTGASVSTPTSECYSTDSEEQVCDYNSMGFIDANYQLVLTTFVGAKGVVSGNNTASKEDPVTGDSVTITETLTDASEFMTIKAGEMVWATSGKLVNKDIPYVKFCKRYQLDRTEDGVTSVNEDILLLSGKVNAASYTSTMLDLEFPAQTLLFSGFAITYNVLSGVYNLNFKLMYKNDGTKVAPKGWNHFWDPDTNTWDTWKLKGVAQTPYEPADFSDLLF